MITRVEIENFKAIEKLSMDFTSRLTVIVGPNGSGKTSILEAINSFEGPSPEGRPRSFCRLGCSLDPQVELFTAKGGVLFIPGEPHGSGAQSFAGENKASAGIPSIVLLHCDYERMAQPSLDGEFLNSDASNVSAVLATLKLTDSDSFDFIEETLRIVIPQIARIRFDRVPMHGLQLVPANSYRGDFYEPPAVPRTVAGFQLLFDTAHSTGIPADSASEGTLMSLGILTALVKRPKEFGCAVLIDDLDASLHPSAQQRLIESIRRLLEVRPNLQVIATTHSPYLLDSLIHDEIRLTTLDDQGRVVCGTLMDHPDFERWKDEMTPGEMWSMFGEKWLTVRPSAEAPAEITP